MGSYPDTDIDPGEPPALPKNSADLKSFLYVEKIACYLKH